jgi:hypothetical protein
MKTAVPATATATAASANDSVVSADGSPLNTDDTERHGGRRVGADRPDASIGS